MSPQSRGRPSDRVGRRPELSRTSATYAHQDESKSAPTERLCPVDGQPVPAGFGRPRTYCSDQCRREMYRLRHELADKEAELADARQKAADGYSPGSYFWDGMAAMHERQLAELRDLVPEEMQ